MMMMTPFLAGVSSSMDAWKEFEKKQHQFWLKGIVSLFCLQTPLECFIERETETFYKQLSDQCEPDPCEKHCDLSAYKPQPKKIPAFDCAVCSGWRDVILANHTSPDGKVMWLNSEPRLWFLDKWEVMKVYMPGGHKKHHSIAEFDVAALLCLLKQCKHFEKFQLKGLPDKLSEARNKIMHAPKYQLVEEDFLEYCKRIRELGELLAPHHPEFLKLTADMDEIQSGDCELMSPKNMTTENLQTVNEKELEEILFGYAEEASEHHLTRMKLEKLERQLAQQRNNRLTMCYDLSHKPRGTCVIFNNEDFFGLNLSSRSGSRRDTESLTSVFTLLGFTVETYVNLTAAEMRRQLQQLGSRDYEDADALVVCVLSHGQMGSLYGVDEKQIYLSEVTRPFTSSRAPSLVGKPKLFFIQACRIGGGMESRSVRLEADGHLEGDANATFGSNSMPWDADFLLGMATVPNGNSFRHKETGSIYIQELCRQLMNSIESSEEDDILNVLTRVNRAVSQNNLLQHRRQIPEPKYTLTKKLIIKSVWRDQDMMLYCLFAFVCLSSLFQILKTTPISENPE